MTPAIQLPVVTAHRPSFFSRLRLSHSQVVAGLGLAVLFEALVDQAVYGLGTALFSVTAAAVVERSSGREATRAAGPYRWLLWASAALMCTTALHASTWFSVLTTLGASVLCGLALLGWPHERALGAIGVWSVAGAPFKLWGLAIAAGSASLSSVLKKVNAGAAVERVAVPLLRLGFIVVPPALVLTALLAAADLSFRERLMAVEQALLSVPISGVVRGGVVIVIGTLMFTGALVVAARRRDEASVGAPRQFLAPYEASVLLAALSGILCVYGLNALTAPTEGPYAYAAREGFFELLVAAGGIVSLTMGLPARVKPMSVMQLTVFRGLATVLVVGAVPLALSGVVRLGAYEGAYGLTRLRVMAYAGLGVVGLVLVWRAVTLWVWRERFVHGALGVATAIMLTLGVLGPDRVIAERNLAHAHLDKPYLLSLSADAVAVAVADERLAVVPSDLEGRSSLATPSLASWNLGEWQGRAARLALEARWAGAVPPVDPPQPPVTPESF